LCRHVTYSLFYILTNDKANVTVVAVPNTICQRKYRLTVAVVPNATMPCFGVLDASSEPAETKSANDELSALSCIFKVAVPFEEKN
jgi:hypothetical protein